MRFNIRHLKHLYKHPLARKRLFKTFCRYFYFHALYRNNEQVTIPFINKKLIIVKGQGGQANYFTELKDYQEMLFLVHYLQENDTFVDVGAHMGSYSILAGITNKVNVHAFEPNSESFKILKQNIKLNNLANKLTAYHLALGEKNTYVKIVNRGACTHINYNDSQELEEIEMKCLDDIISSVNIMKIDVEGYEENVLIGSNKLMKDPKLNAIIIEMSRFNRYGSTYHRVHELLNRYGFNAYYYDPKNRQLQNREEYNAIGMGWWNIIYIKNIDLALDCVKSSKKIKVNGRWY